jgi:hypothetical protein
MPDYRRYRVPGGTYFFTVTLAHRSSGVLVRHIGRLREAFQLTGRERLFRIDAIVVLTTTCTPFGFCHPRARRSLRRPSWPAAPNLERP